MDDDTGYLRRLGLTARPPATLAGLRQVHRAHVARIPYDNLSIMLGRPDPASTRLRAWPCRGGGAAGLLLPAERRLRVAAGLAGVLGEPAPRARLDGARGQLETGLNHLVLVVSGLPTDDNPGGHWWADAGLGEGFAEPLPLVRGDHVVDGWAFGIGAGYGAQAAGRPTGPAAWTYRHLPGGVLTGASS